MQKPAYNFVDATFAFFQLMGRRPGSVLWIALWQLALYAALSVLILALMAPFFSFVLTAAAQGVEPEPADVLRAMSGVIGGYFLAILGFLLAALVVQGAWLRLLTRDELAPVIPLRFGGDELRLLVVNLAFFAFWLVASIVFFLVVGLASGGIILASSTGDSVSPAGAGVAVLINFLLGLAAAVLAIIVMIRFAAAPALSVRLKGIKLFDSFAATKGVASWMFVSYLTLIGVYLVGATIVAVVQQVVVLFAAAELIPTLSALENTEDPQVVLQVLGEALLQPGVLISFAVILLLQLIFQIIFEGSWHGVGAYVARREAGDFPDDAIITPSASVGDAPGEG
jgi:hypothetical protein